MIGAGHVWGLCQGRDRGFVQLVEPASPTSQPRYRTPSHAREESVGGGLEGSLRPSGRMLKRSLQTITCEPYGAMVS